MPALAGRRSPDRSGDEGRDLAERNRWTARWLVAWIAFLMVVSLIVIWVRN